jgi:hypothetical protein
MSTPEQALTHLLPGEELRAQGERIGNTAERCGRARCPRGCVCHEGARAVAEPSVAAWLPAHIRTVR